MNDPHNSDQECPTRKKDFQLSGDDKTPRKVSGKEDDTTPNKSTSGSDSIKKDSPSNLLPNIKGFNIERSRYQHYGHKSSMNAQSLDRIINEEKQKLFQEAEPITKIEESHEAEEKDDSDKLSVKSEKSSRSRSRSRSRSGSDSSNFKYAVEESMGKLLGLPQDKEASWPYSSETLSELLRFKTEQERTKQEEIRNEFASTTLQLLTLAKSMNINNDLIPHLFNNSLNDMQKNLDTLKSNPRQLIDNIHDSTRKRRFSDSVRPHAPSITTHDIPPQSQSALVSPMRSPTRLPTSAHRRMRSDDNDQVAFTVHSPSSAVNPSYSESFSSQQHSPNQVAQGAPPSGMYPVYYHQGPPPPPPAGPHGVQTPSNENNSSLGSPYQQKYQVMYHHHPPPPPPPGPSSHPSQGQPPQTQPYSNHYMPQRQYHYYIASPPNQPAGHGQYPATSMIPPLNQVQPGLYAPPETKEVEDPSPSYKKQKSVSTGRTGSSGGINFMISTPKNPPARKYNNPSKDK